MLYDLKGDANMSPTVGMLYSAVKENHQRLQLITDGMSQEELDYKGPNSNYNSTAQLINHIMYVDLNWIYRIKGQPFPNSLENQYGPVLDTDNKLPKVKNMSLESLITEYESVLTKLKDTCTQLSDADLDKVVTFGLNDENEATIRWGLWHIADHNRYHQAHINQLRKWYSEVLRES
ncbi:DinB family protein [Alkalibacillus salilacus]|uniref:Damage-inducible protein DinB n=1 Tax=Alkalibacillus salilacus TaxID=284582 RepID=A0ABT9VF59_9BACI|nr:DinB family protein [Alkalibacillus salilacus]MDQ0159606.1 putative damage-inducible protein DinB [Alkalibacillus salilacus]